MPLEVDSVTKENFDKIKKISLFTYVDVKIITRLQRFWKKITKNVCR